MRHYRILIKGVVQGVGFRPCIYRVATSMGLTGYVRNTGSDVEVVVDLEPERFMEAVRRNLPSIASISSYSWEVTDYTGSGFEIDMSTAGTRGSPVPPDTAMCAECLEEMLTEGNRRYMYPFTNCTQCGARFSIIKDVPYDRKNTSMDAFPMCSECQAEYSDPGNRRFHAQTLSCGREGLGYTLHMRDGSMVPGDPVRTFARMLDEGKLGAVKGWGGMHIACTLEAAGELRRRYRRPQKPLAVMVRDLEAAGRYAVLDEHSQELLLSPQRPIVLVPKRETVPEQISPGLESIGIFLPYSGVQHLIFHHLKHDALVMTSANLPGEPMCTDNSASFSLDVDVFLLHNREILNRIDDSVVIPYRDTTLFIRRSRGYVPVPLQCPHSSSVLGVGAQENLTSSVAVRGEVIQSQYIGDGRNYDVLVFHEQAARHLMRLFGVDALDAVVMDLHPGYTTRRLAKRVAAEHGAELMEVQHHWAHMASLMVDAGMDFLVCLTLDGTGYGEDGTVWGAEVLRGSLSEYSRVGSVSTVPLIGADRAVIEVERVVFALQKLSGAEVTVLRDREDILERVMKNSVRASSMGRILDAISARLGICTEMTYDGEPAMKLETLLLRGRHTYEFPKEFLPGEPKRADVNAMYMRFEELIQAGAAPEDAAFSFVDTLIDALTDLASDHAEGAVGITGGVAYSIPINNMFMEHCRRKGLRPVLHSRIQCGDGGISVGQCAVGGAVSS